jgi:type IVB pilus formation R64 PilN family outer membrane protein
MKLKSAISIATALVLTGCAYDDLERKESSVDLRQKEVTQNLQTVRTPNNRSVVSTPSSYLPLKKLVPSGYTATQTQMLAQEVETNRQFANLNEVATWLSTVASAPVNIHPELMVQQSGAAGTGGAPGAAGPAMAGAAGMGAGGMGGVLLAVASKPLHLSYSGSLSGFLDIVAANYGIYWKLDDGHLRFFLNESRTFRIKTLPGDTQLASTVGSSLTNASSGSGGGGSGGSSGGGSGGVALAGGNTTGVSSTLSVWNGIEASIKQMLTPITGKVAVSPSTGTVTVTDNPRVLSKVADLVDAQNASLARQVAIHVRVLSVTVNDSEDYGINWNAVYNSLSSNQGYKISSAFPVATSNAAQFTMSPTNTGANGWGAASNAVISALSSQSKVSELTSATMITLNNQPAPVQVGRQISYLASSTTTLASSAGSSTALQPGQVQTGFSMVLLPHIMDSKELLLQSSINISSLLDLKSNSSGTSTIQSPDVATSNFIQRVRMQSGDTLILAGFDQDNLSAVANGVGFAKNPVLGAANSFGKRTMLVILVQPFIGS